MCHFISTSSNVIVSGQFWGGNMRLGALCFLRLPEVRARLSSRAGVGLYAHACFACAYAQSQKVQLSINGELN